MILAAATLSSPHVWGTSIIEWVTAFVAVFAVLPVLGLIANHLICHEPGCWRPGKHSEDHFRLCGNHHSGGPRRKQP